jgi:hypothetical protein
MFDYINGNLPASFNDYFTKNTKIHHHDTKKSNSVHKIYFRTNYRKFSIKTKGTDLWNKIPSQIKYFSSKIPFKHAVKKKILSQNK